MSTIHYEDKYTVRQVYKSVQTEKPQYRCTTTIHPVYNCWKKISEKLLHVWLSVRTNLFIPGRFWTTATKFDTCCLRYVARCGKNLYRYTSTVSALNYCSRIFSNPSAIYTKWCAHTFPPIFRIFAIFDRNFAKIMAPPSHENENYVARLKEQSLLKKAENPVEIGQINGNWMLVRTMQPSNERCSGLGAWQKTPYFRILCDLPQTLHGDRARRAHHKSCHSFFWPNAVFPTGYTEKFGRNLPTRGFSAITP